MAKLLRPLECVGEGVVAEHDEHEQEWRCRPDSGTAPKIQDADILKLIFCVRVVG